MPSAESFIMPDAPSSDRDDVDSLPSDSSSLDSEEDLAAQEEWERSVQQLQVLLTMVLIPVAGKYFGRQFAYWSWARYMEWMHDVEIRWVNPRLSKAVGLAEAASSL